MRTTGFRKLSLAVTLSLLLTLGLVSTGFGQAGQGQQEIEICATIAQRLVFSLTSGESVTLVVDPVDNPTAEGSSSFEVKTNVSSYSITANFGAFEVADTGYDLIGNENFRISSVAPDEGDAVYDWTVPEEEMSVLSGETGYTNSEITTVNYQLNVDFSVPQGEAQTTIVFTAAVTM